MRLKEILDEDLRKGLRLFSVYFLLALVVLAGLTVPLYQSQKSKVDSLRNITERNYLGQAKFYFANEVEKLISDSYFINSLNTVNVFLESNGLEQRRVTEILLSKFASVYGRYHQIALLSAQGKELVRVNYHDREVGITPSAQLKDRSATIYFKTALTIKPNQIFVMPPTVVRKNDHPDDSFLPVYRMLLAKYDESGAMVGIVVLTYNLQGLYEIFHSLMSYSDEHEAMIVDDEGRLIYREGHAPEDLLKFDPIYYRDEHPEVWGKVLEQVSGQVRTPGGITYFTDLTGISQLKVFNYTEGLSEDTIQVTRARQSWRILLFVPNDVIEATGFFRQPGTQFVYGVLLVFILLLASFATRYRMARLRLLESDDKLKREHLRLYEDAPCGYVSIDRSGRIKKINQTLLHWLGYENEDLVDKIKFRRLAAANCSDKVVDMISQLKIAGYTRDVSLDLVRKDDTLLPSTLSGRANFDHNGNLATVDLSVIDATDRRKMESLLSLQAQTDELTGLKNRRAFFELANIEWTRAWRYDRPLSVILFDVDNFKKINDNFGHAVGDKVLLSISSAVEGTFRRDAFCARYGGDEFIALLPETTLDDALVLAERFRKGVEESRVETASGAAVRMSISVGIAAMSTSDSNIHTLINKADEALYHAKGEGRNTVVVYRPKRKA